ncbi:MAG: hypothetical protein GXP13_04965 [Gammaproteobacteria bacterium]|nr:hypothetical protein [Gammaproteobacteria bacterium]
MQEYKLKFARFIYDDSILEIIIHADIEVTSSMVTEVFDLIKSIEPKISLILVNRINLYSYSFKANIMLATSKLADYVAVVKYGRLPWPLKGFLTPKFYRMAFFDERNTAIDWLNTKKID